MRSSFLLLLPLASTCLAATAQPVAAPRSVAPATSWSESQSREILDKTETIRLAPDISHLGPGERAAVERLIEVGRIFQDIY